MIYLSRVRMDRRTALQHRLKDSYAWHQAIWRAFPEQDKRSFLFRLDERMGDFTLLILSERKPCPMLWGCWETKTIAPAFLDHHRYRFQLRANPTRKVSREDKKNGTRVPIYDLDHLLQWLQRKGETGGFQVVSKALEIGAPVNQYFNAKGKRGNHKRVDFAGMLNVTDRVQFEKTFTQGIGSAKAFGFGLLMLQPVIEREEK